MKPFNPKEYKLVSLRECPLPAEMQLCDTPDKVADYWNAAIKSSPLFNPECECFFALLLNTRRRVKAHVLSAHAASRNALRWTGSVNLQAASKSVSSCCLASFIIETAQVLHLIHAPAEGKNRHLNNTLLSRFKAPA
jgi:hypothetical protein